MAEISVIVPVFNAEGYLAACLDSILAQTFSDFEVILADDGSTDRSGELCEAYAARDSRIRVFHQENAGQAAARNRAMEIAAGDWFCFVDSDDLIHPQMLKCLALAAKNSGAPIAMCRMQESPELPKDFLAPRQGDFQVYPMDERTLLSLHDRDAYPGWVACAKLIRRELCQHYPFCPGRVYEDNEAVCRWLIEGKKLAYLPEKMYYYRTNAMSTTQKAFSVKRLDYLWALESIILFYDELGYTTLAERFCDRYAEAAAGCYHRLKFDLDRRDLARQVDRDARALFRDRGIPMTRSQFVMMFDEMHPHLIRLYYPLDACRRRFRAEGLGGMFRAIVRQLGREKHEHS